MPETVLTKERMMHPRMERLHKTVENLYLNNHMTIRQITKAVSHSLSYRQVLAILQPLISQRKSQEEYLSPEDIEARRKEIRDAWTPEQAKRRWIGTQSASRRLLVEAEASQILE